jgi:elongation factor P
MATQDNKISISTPSFFNFMLYYNPENNNNQTTNMLKHNEIRKGRIIVLGEDPYEVTKYSHVVKGRGKSVVQTQLKNMRTGGVLQKTFHPGESAEEADLEKIGAVFVYRNKNKFIFHEEGNPSKRFELSKDQLDEKADYLKEKTVVTTLLFKEKIIGIFVPIKMNFKVIAAPPGVKGNRAEGGTKVVTIETGKNIDVPLFIEEGDLIEVNTETGEYAKRIQQ